MKLVFNKIKLAICLILTLILPLFTTSCRSLEYEYKADRLLKNVYNANDSMYAKGTAYNIVIPSVVEENIVENIGAEAYFIASVDRFSSSYTKFHNAYKKMSMASLTKLMTALIVLENCKDLNEEYYVTMDAVDLEKGVSKASLRSGDKLTVYDLLCGLLIPSGNDAALCLAENLVDSYDNFIIMMNNEAERLGAINSHFANAHGLDSDHHFTTAYDLFLITRELVKYKEFMEISIKKNYTANIKNSDGTIRTETWENTNYFVTEELLMNSNVTLNGGKTGNTTNAGNCLVLYVSDNKTNIKYISVVLGAKSKRNSYYNSNALVSAIKN